VKSTYITDDTELIAADANESLIAATTELAEQSRKYENLDLSPEAKRKLKLLKLSLTLPAPKDPAERSELTKIAASMEGEYGKGKYCPDGDKGKCLSLPDLENIINNSRDPEELKKAWVGWHQIAIPIRKEYVRFVELSNKGAKEMGFKDTGAMWRSKYDMEPDAFAAEMERLWQQVKPLYDSLYTYTGANCREVRQRRRLRRQADSAHSARKHVGAAVGQHLSDTRARERRSRLRSDANTESEKH
jgi:peptidyl-dipeptidase A